MDSCDKCVNLENNLIETRKELVGNLIHANNTINNLKIRNDENEALIYKIESELKNAKEDINRIKAERNTKNEQLKLKNKVIEKATSNFEKHKLENENIIKNY